MASTKIRGITIELGADTSGLSSALKNVNSEIGKTQKELKDVERLLKLDPKNTELLAQKQKLLNDKVEETKTKLDALKQAQKSIDLSTEDGQRQYDALTREIVSCEHELKNAEQAASYFNSTMSKVSTVTGNMSKKFGDLANKTRGLSMAAGGAVAGLGGLAVKVAKDADELNTLAKQTGVATDELQKMQYASELIDVDTETIIGGLRKLKKNLDGHEESWQKIGVNVKNANGEYKDITTIFYDTIKGLSGIANETERDKVAMDLFGKSADELAGVIDDGGAALKALGEEAENLGVIIPQEDIDKASELNDTLDKLKAEILPTITKLGIQVIEAIQPYIPKIQAAIEKICDALKNVSPELVLIVGGVLAVTAALSPLFSVLSSVTGAISALTGSTGALGGALAGLSAPILAIVAVIGVLVAAFVHLWNTNEEFRNSILEIWNSLTGAFKEFGDGIVQRLNAMGGNFKSFGDVVKAVWDMICKNLAPQFKSAFEMVASILKGALNVLMGLFDTFAGLFTGNWSQMWNGIKTIFSGIWEAIKGILKAAVNTLSSTINGLISGINKISVGGHSVNIPLIPMLANGGILTEGTAIVGEAGAEMLSVSNGQAMVQPLGGQQGTSELTGLLETYLPYLAMKQALYLDGNVLVGQTANRMNEALGTIAFRSKMA